MNWRTRGHWKTKGKIAEESLPKSIMPEVILELQKLGYAYKTGSFGPTSNEFFLVVYDTWENLKEGEKGR